jgi:hypothetical protein
MPSVLTLMEAQASGHITQIRGTDSSIGMIIEVQNNSNEAITITSEPGTVIGSKDSRTQRMVIIREKSWTIPPQKKVSITVDALCLEAHKAAPRSTGGEANHSIEGTTENADVRTLLKTLQEVEAKISANITAVDREHHTVRHTLDSPSLVELAQAASHTEVKGQESFLSQIYDFIVQMPVWELTDHLGVTDYAKVTGRDRPETHEELRKTVEAISATAKIAEILLKEAELSHKQTIQPVEDELEILYVEHEILSSGISKLRLAAIAPGAGKESVRIELNEKQKLLDGKEREIRIYPHKNTLIEELSKLSITNSLAGRTTLLSGMQADSLERDENIKRHDLDVIISQLARLGRDETGDILLVKLIDNALPYAEGFEIHEKLRSLRSEFESL